MPSMNRDTYRQILDRIMKSSSRSLIHHRERTPRIFSSDVFAQPQNSIFGTATRNLFTLPPSPSNRLLVDIVSSPSSETIYPGSLSTDRLNDNVNTQLAKYCETGSIKDVVYFLTTYKNQIDANYQSGKSSSTAFMYACQHKISIAAALIESIGSSININQQNTYGYTALMIACMYQPSIVPFIAEYFGDRIDVTIQDNYQHTAITYACMNHSSALEVLVTNYGDKIDIRRETKHGYTDFIFACESQPRAVKILLDHYGTEIDVNHQTDDNNTALIQACMFGQLDTVMHLLDYFGDEININHKTARGETAMMITCKYYPSIAGELVMYFEDAILINDKDINGFTALDYARKYQSPAVNLLIDYFDNMLAGIDIYDKNILDHSVHFSRQYNYSKSEASSESNAAAEDKTGSLIAAVERADKKTIVDIIQNYADQLSINGDYDDGSAFIRACRINRYDIIKLLIENFADKIDINAQDGQGNTALTLLCDDGPIDSISAVIERFASDIDINHQTCNGMTALMYACQHNRLNVVRLLAKNFMECIDVYLQNEDGDTIYTLSKNLKIHKILNRIPSTQ